MCYLEAVITKNAEEGDDGVCYSQEMEAWLHVSAPLLQNKANCSFFFCIITSRISRGCLFFLYLCCR